MADVNFVWHGLVFEWHDPTTCFDNHKQTSDRWGTGVARPVGKLWVATLKFGHCEASGGGDTPEGALDSAFRQIERDVAEVRERMQEDLGTPGKVIECDMCTEPATRWHVTRQDEKVFYCDPHAAEIMARHAEAQGKRWGVL